MLVELINEVALDCFEGLIHAKKHNDVPVWRQAQKLTEAIRVELDECEGDSTVQ